MDTCLEIYLVCACAKAIVYHGISWAVPRVKCTQCTFMETPLLEMETAMIHLE